MQIINKNYKRINRTGECETLNQLNHICIIYIEVQVYLLYSKLNCLYPGYLTTCCSVGKKCHRIHSYQKITDYLYPCNHKTDAEYDKTTIWNQIA